MVAVASILIAGILALQAPQVQTYLAAKVLDMVTGSSDADIRFEKILFKPFNAVILKNAAVIDRSPQEYGQDTLFSAGYVIARFSLKGLREKEGLHIGRAYIRDAQFNLVIEENGTNLQRIFGLEKKEKKENQGNVFDIRRVFIDDMKFSLVNMKHRDSSAHKEGIDWADLEMDDISIEARNLRLSGKIMSGSLDVLSFKEKSGYICNSISGSASVGNGLCEIRDLRISDPWSEVDIPLFTMNYDDALAFRNFISDVRMSADIAESRLSMKTLSFFAPGAGGGDTVARIMQAQAEGSVCDLDIRNITLEAGGVGLSLSGSVKGLPDIRSLRTDVNIAELSGTTGQIESLLKGWTGARTPDISRYASGYRLHFNGRFNGRLDDLKFRGTLRSGAGSLYADLGMRGFGDSRKTPEIRGDIRTRNLDIRKMTGAGPVHECTMKSSLNATFGDGGARLGIDSLRVERLNFNGYDYSNIAAAGTLSQNEFDGKIICNDPNLNFLFQGIFTISSKTQNALYRFYANVGYADLNALRIDNRGTSKIRFQTVANFNRISKGDMLGNIDIGGIVAENSGGKYQIGDINLSSHSSNELYRVRLTSDFAEGTFSGSGSLPSFIRDLKDITLKRELPAMFRDSTYTWESNRYALSFRMKNSMDLLSFALPGLYIAEGTSLNIAVDTSGTVKGKLLSQRIAFREQFMKDIALEFDNSEGNFTGELRSETVSAATLTLKNNRMKLFAMENHIGFGYTYNNQGNMQNRGELYMLCDLERDMRDSLECRISLLPSSIYLNSREWSIMPSGLSICGSSVDVPGIEFRSGDQSVRIYGRMSGAGQDTLSLGLDRFDLSIINPILGKNADISGAVTGSARLLSEAGRKGLLLDFICDSAKVSGAQMGTVRLSSEWDKSSKRFNISLNNSISGKSTFDIGGYYSPDRKTTNVTARLDRFDISCAQPFLSGIFSETSGYLSGVYTLSGPVQKLALGSTGARLDNARLRIGFTNVPYDVNGIFHIDSHGVYFDDLTLKDRYGNTGSVTGEISYENFRNIRFNTRIDADRIECIDLDEKQSQAFYGNIYATAGITLSGPVNALKMSIDATTTGRGQLHVPISSSATSSSSNLLTFKEIKQEVQIDPYEAMVSRLKKKEKSANDLDIRLRVAATPGLEAFVEIDKSTGNVLSGHGSGVIDLVIRPSRDIFNINGDYTLSGGNYKFVAIGFAKDFTISEGSSIRFNGDIMESTLNIDAIYRTKTSLATLISDTTSVSSRRTVECGIKITDKISNPRLQFSINVPDIDPTVKSRVESALSTEDKVQKQFLSLLVSNSFIPDEQSGIVNNSAFLSSSVSEIMSNQLNNIFQKLDIPLDLGLNYQPNERGNDIFDVAVSTQLFNNRVIVNGNIGNRQYSTGNTGSDVVGDLDIEIKLDRPGALRLNLFSHSADQYTNYLDNSQRNGIGLTYQQEFNSFREFFRNLFSKRKKREAMQRAEEKAILNEEKVVISIKKKESR